MAATWLYSTLAILTRQACSCRRRTCRSRLNKYGGDHVELSRIALTRKQVRDLPSFPAEDKKKDPRYDWFVANYGDLCWELDAMDPNDLRDCVEEAIKELIDPVAWERSERVNKATRD